MKRPENSSDKPGDPRSPKADLHELKLFLPEPLYRAWQRCSWAITAETGKDRLEVMQEMVHDFLVKHGC